MKLITALRTMSAAAVMTVASMSAMADYVILDNWGLAVPGFATSTGIGHLNLSSGGATVQQQVNASGQAYVGARFVENGNILSISYTAESGPPGGNDSGSTIPFGGLFSNQLRLVFTNVSGVVTSLNGGGGFHYAFVTGSYSLQASTNSGGIWSTVATGSIVGLGGNTGATAIIGGTTGDSTILADILSSVANFDVLDSNNVSLLPEMGAGGDVLFQATTNNRVSAVLGLIPAPNSGFDCGLGTDANGNPVSGCLSVFATSDGALDVVRKLPEPDSLALVGLAVLGLGAARRRAAKV